VKVVLLISAISSDNTGMGGHYYSVRSIAKALRLKGVEAHILVLGDMFPKAYDDIRNDVSFVKYKPFRYFSYFSRISECLKDIGPDVIHSFDNKSFFVARLMSLLHGYRLVLTKPGGPNPTTFFPYCKDLILFSSENETYFRGRRKFHNSRICHIPNRVEAFDSDWTRIAKLKADIPSDQRVILRIGRIGEAYAAVIRQTGNLVRYLKNNGIAVTGLVVGVAQDETLLSDLKVEYSDELVIKTDDEFTKNAAELIEVSDVVVGTGRSLMEAACKSRVLMTTISGSEYPVLVGEDNFLDLMATNFSPRNNLIGYDENKNLSAIVDLFANETNFHEAQLYSERVSSEYFDLSSAMKRYMAVYSNAETESVRNMYDVLLNVITFLRYYLPIYSTSDK